MYGVPVKQAFVIDFRVEVDEGLPRIIGQAQVNRCQPYCDTDYYCQNCFLSFHFELKDESQ